MWIRKRDPPPPPPPRPPPPHPRPLSLLRGPKTTKGVYCSLCFAVEEDNRGISWEALSDKSHQDPREKMTILISVGHTKEHDKLCSLYIPSQKEVMKGGNRENDPTKMISSSAAVNPRNTKSFGAVASHVKDIPPSSSEQVAKNWHQTEVALPLKRKRRSRIVEEEEAINEENIETEVNVEITKKKKDREYTGGERILNPRRKGKEGNELMEGSRCTRVNGRGWRCKQITLMGYSLCQHHLGMARTRSMGKICGDQQENPSHSFDEQ